VGVGVDQWQRKLLRRLRTRFLIIVRVE
jgi:hypothetical protein